MKKSSLLKKYKKALRENANANDSTKRQIRQNYVTKLFFRIFLSSVILLICVFYDSVLVKNNKTIKEYLNNTNINFSTICVNYKININPCQFQLSFTIICNVHSRLQYSFFPSRRTYFLFPILYLQNRIWYTKIMNTAYRKENLMPQLKDDIYTLEDIYALPDGQRAELIDGVIYDMTPPNRIHQKLY